MKRRNRLRRRLLARRRSDDRRGVLLLVVLSMLVLFLLIGTTFLVTTGQYRTAAKIVEKAHRTTYQPADLLERALMQVVRDTNNSSSVVRYHSLLRDLYGVDGLAGRVNAITENPLYGIQLPTNLAVPHYAGAETGRPLGPTNGQMVDLYVTDYDAAPLLDNQDRNLTGLDFDENGVPLPQSLSTTDAYYNGALLTFLSGPCRGVTVRVIDYDFVGSNFNTTFPDIDSATVAHEMRVGRLRVMAPRRIDGQSLRVTGDGALPDLIEAGTQGCRFILNGRPFNGAGVGFNPLALTSGIETAPSARLSAAEYFSVDPATGPVYGIELALVPNAVTYMETANHFLNPSSGVDPWAPPGGVDYTQADFPALTRGFVTSGEAAYDAATSPLYKTFAGPGDTDESYDAPDTQNMALASQALEPRLRGRVVDRSSGDSLDPDAYYPAGAAPAYLDLEGVTIPSFHRPALANFWFHRLWRSSWLTGLVPDANERVRAVLEPYDANGAPQHGLDAQTAAQIAAIKRKFMLRPLREDHPDFDGSNPLSRYATTKLRNAFNGGALINPNGGASNLDAEITFPYWEAVGPWDVDNDGDGVPDSVWVDLGLPVQQTEDGRWYKPLVAILVEDLDGRLNLNAHGSEADLASINPAATVASPNDQAAEDLDRSRVIDVASGGDGGDWNANLAQDYVSSGSLFSSNQLPQGAGWGVAETSLRSVLSPTLTLDEAVGGAGGYTGNAQYDDYARVLYGRPSPGAANRTVAPVLNQSVTFGRYGSAPSAVAAPSIELTKPGRTFVTDPSLIASRAVLSSVRDARTPYDYIGYPAYTDQGTLGGLEAHSGFSSPADLRGRYAVGLGAAGAPVHEPTSEANSFRASLGNFGLTWREFPANAPDDSPYEVDLSVEARKLAPVSAAAVRRSYDLDGDGQVTPGETPLVDDAPFSPAELERILRAFDADADTLPDRLWNVVDAVDPAKLAAHDQIAQAIRAGSYNPTAAFNRVDSLQSAVASAKAAVNRRVLTTDSYDLPVPNENWSDRLLLGADGLPGVPRVNDDTSAEDLAVDEGDEVVIGYNANTQSHTYLNGQTYTYQELFDAGCDDYVVVMREDPPSPARLTDFLRYRVVLELLRKDVINFNDVTTRRALVNRHVEEVVFGPASRPAGMTGARSTNLDSTPVDMTARPLLASYGGLLAPEVLAGRRMDLNRHFGDGRDNNGNGVVDEPQEAGEPYTFTVNSGVVAVTNYQDMNKSGGLDQDVDGDGSLYFDRAPIGAPDGAPDRFSTTDLDASTNEPRFDNLWVDDNANGLRDANEFRPFDYTRGADANGRGDYLDGNGNGVYDVGEQLIHDDARVARQLFARHLYCLMLSLVDENYLAPYDPDDLQVRHYLDPLSGDSVGGLTGAGTSVAYQIALERFQEEFASEIDDGTIPASQTHVVSLTATDPALETRRLLVIDDAIRIAMRKLTCRTIAQWAINVVDFRDPDAIQSEFEYDENPWDGWNVVAQSVGTDGTRQVDAIYPLDGDLTTDENLTQTRSVTNAGFVAPADPDGLALRQIDRTRGVVWGAERPEVLLTEGVAWHDRRLEDWDNPKVDDGGQVLPSGEGDDDLDQLRKPKGSTFLEAYNPWIGDDQRPAEFYSHVDRDGNVSPRLSGVRFDRLSNLPADRADATQTRSPVWRISCIEEHPLLRNSTFVQPSGSGVAAGLASDDPPTFRSLGGGAGGAQSDYLGVSLNNLPWQYASDGQQGVTRLPALPNAYRSYWYEQIPLAAYAIATDVDLASGLTGGNADADGIPVPAGVLEHPPTIPDPSFPTFDRFDQPGIDPEDQQFAKTVTVKISSTVDGDGPNAGGGPRTVERHILLKPTRFIERVFYMAAPNSVTQARVQKYPLADLQNPGFKIPVLGYELPVGATTLSASDTSTGNRFDTRSKAVGVERAGARKMRVLASKFAYPFDRADADADGVLDEVIPLAPLLPGRRAVIGSVGEVYPTTPTLADEIEGAGDSPYSGDNAFHLRRRYATILSQPLNTGKPPTIPFGVANRETRYAGLRRFEMIPSSDPDQHQFAIRFNGLNESFSVRLPVDNTGNGENDAFNVTAGRAFYEADPTTAAAQYAAPPVIAVPMGHFSISEPLDEYLVRQIELDPDLSYQPYLNLGTDVAANSPIEDHYKEGIGGDPTHFDEPFDLLPELVENQTTPNYRSLHLERLANPLLPWNPPPARPNGTQPIYKAKTATSFVDQNQHDPDLPVNPYLPVDARALDLTAFNSFSDKESSLVAPSATNKYVTPGADGPGVRHRRVRQMPNAVNKPLETVIGFTSIERGRPLGPFPVPWLFQPARLLWKQAGGSTFSELAHTYAKSFHNGYQARVVDQVRNTKGTLGADWTESDRVDLATPVTYREHVVDFAWRFTLGFDDWMSGEFYTGSGLTWLNQGVEAAFEAVDLNGDGAPYDLIARPEITDNPLGVNEQQDLDGNGRPDSLDGANFVNIRNNAKDFLERYLQTQAHDNATTPELHWPNRPFASPGELLQVPAWGGSRMLTYFSVFNWQHTQQPGFLHRNQVNPYNGEALVFHDGLDYKPADGGALKGYTFDGNFADDDTEGDNDSVPEIDPTNALRFRETLGHFGHLANFFQTARYPADVTPYSKTNLDGDEEPYVIPRGASHYYRLLDYVCVPSRFVATDTLLNPETFGDAAYGPNDPRAQLSAPFNHVDRYREPGRVNLNTVAGRRDSSEPKRVNPGDGTAVGTTLPRLPDYWSEVYDGLMHRTQDGSSIDYASGSLVKLGRLGPAWRDVALSRRGYVQAGFNPTLNPNLDGIGLESVGGQNQIDYSPRRMHPDFPTMVANPFRAPGEGANVPLAHMVQTGVDATLLRAHPLSPGADGAWGRRGVDDRVVNKDRQAGAVANVDGNRDDANEAGVQTIQLAAAGDTPALSTVDRLTSDVVLAKFQGAGSRRGAVPDTFLGDALRTSTIDTNPREVTPQDSRSLNVHNVEISKRVTPVPLFSGASLEPSLDTERNATLRYQPIQSLSNQTTTRSNVYAVWITVGYFEVTPAREDARVAGRYFNTDGTYRGSSAVEQAVMEDYFFRVYPDGWMLGEEIGRDTGEARRSRGFYIVDRSRPVGFKPGEDANVSDTILVRRRIE